MTPTEYAVDLLGGPGVFQVRALPDASEVRSRIQKGLPFRSLETVRARLRLSVPELAASSTGSSAEDVSLQMP